MKNSRVCLWAALLLVAGAHLAAAQNTTFSYQGRLQDNGTNYSGAGLFQFALITTNSTATNTLWSNDGTSVSGSEPAAAVTIAVTNGLFTVALGSPVLANMAVLPVAVFAQSNVQLRIWFNDGVNGFTAFPLQNLVPAPYASYAAIAGTVSGTIALAQLPPALATLAEPGSENIFLGSSAGNTNLAGQGNVGTGSYALNSITSGGNNTANGGGALFHNTSGNDNTANGAGTLEFNSTGSFNTAAGFDALEFSTNDSGVVAVGFEALANDNAQGRGAASTFGENTAVGYEALETDTTGFGNTALGYLALQANDGSYDNTALGERALAVNTGDDNTASGSYALAANTTGYQNTADGGGALYANTTGYKNLAVGDSALEDNTTGFQNTAAGFQALQFNMTGAANTADGYNALSANTTGNNNTAAGTGALVANTTGDYNSVMGAGAMSFNISGSYNTAAGAYALDSDDTGGYNTALGLYALSGVQSGTNNIGVGVGAGAAFTSGETGNIDIGNAGVTGESGIIRIGTAGTQTKTYLAGTVYANNVQLTSDRNAKENFTAINAREILAKVVGLPVTQWNYKDTKVERHIGPMAQDFQAAFQLGKDDRHIAVVDEGGVALAAIQGLNEKLNERDAEIAQLQIKAAKVEALEKQLAGLAAAVKALTEKH